MRVLVAASLALLALLCLLPVLTPSGSALVSAAAPKQAAAASAYVAANRDLEEEDDEDVPAPRTSSSGSQKQQQQQIKQQRAAAEEEEEADDERADASPMLLHLTLEHSIGSAPFARRGDVSVNFNPARGAKALTFSAPQTGSKKAASAALQANPATLYRMRFVQDGQSSDEALMASIPLCALAVSHWHENFVLSVDPYGQLISVTYRTPLSDCSSGEARAALAGTDTFTFTPKAKISFGKPGSKAQLSVRPGFDASSQANAQAVGAEPSAAPAAAAKEAEKGPDGKPIPPPQTFWQKYWIYIVPMGIYVILQAVMAPAEAPAGAGGAGGGAPQSRAAQ